MLFRKLSRKSISAFTLVVVGLLFFFITSLLRQHTPSYTTRIPEPTEGEENEKLRERYQALRHRTRDGSDWRMIEARNLEALKAELSVKRKTFGLESFANGAIYGEWQERGALNQTGSVRAIDYVAATNTFYNISNGGSIWSSVQGSGAWVLRNQSARFEPRTICAFTKSGGGTRLLVAADLKVYYSDNEGQTLTPATGISFPVDWGGNFVAAIIRLNDAGNTIYCLTRPWSDSPWGDRFWLYRSTNQGASFTKIYSFDFGDEEQLSLCNPYNTNLLYAADAVSVPGSIRLSKITGSSLAIVNTAALGITISKCLIKGTLVNGVLTLYALINNNQLWKSENEGQTWTKQSTLPETAWMKMNVSPLDPARVAFGGVNAYRSINAGVSWLKVNNWSDYYGSEASKLHADIMEIEYFKRSDDAVFTVVNTHGGCYTSYDNLQTVANQSLSSHLATEYYDVLTDTFNTARIFTGTQDQGLQRTTSADQPGIRNFLQVISGDYGQLCLTKKGEFLWPQYPGGTFYLYTDLGSSSPTYVGTWSMQGDNKPNVGWMLPTSATADAAANEIWMGGGNINGGPGSYLCKLKMQTTSPYTVTATQLNYDFMANSNSQSSGISAIEQSLINPSKLFVAAEDGSFFFSNDLGVSWSRSSNFNGPGTWYLYGSCILASHINEKTVWYAGSGYSSPPVYKSVDGGVTFTSMSAGLPNTLVNELVASPDERFLFAATEAGPYVYVVADKKWYTLAGTNTPLQFFTSVEYISEGNIVRFGTMGRGIFDLKLADVSAIYTFTGSGNWDVSANWMNQKRPPNPLAKGDQVIVNPPANGEAVLNVQQQVGAGAKISVSAGKKLKITGKLNINQTVGAALNFDGVNDYVQIPNNTLLKPASGITIEAWIRATDIHTNKLSTVYRKEDGSSRHLLAFKEYGTMLVFGLQTGGVYTELTAPVTAADFEGKWVHLAATYNGSSKNLYKNGVLVSSVATTGNISTSGSADAFIGSNAGNSEFFNGSIDEFRLLNNGLAGATVQATMNCELKTLPAGIILYYKFNQGYMSYDNTGGTGLPDAGSNKINAKLVNFALKGDNSNWTAPGGVVLGTACQ